MPSRLTFVERLKRDRFWLSLGVGTAAILALTWAGSVGTSGSTFTDWLEAVATFAAFVAAVIAARYAAGAFRVESQRERRLDQDRRQSQAALVAAWYRQDDEPMRVGPSATGPAVARRRVPVVVLRNASDLPVTQVRVALFAADDDESCWAFLRQGVIPPGDQPFIKRVNEGRRRENDGWLNAVDDVSTLLVALRFTDARGRTWERWTDGQLSERPREGWDTDFLDGSANPPS